MSLVVWLPLTKDLRQQGLSNITVTNNGAIFNSAGRLGGCYEFASGKRIQTTLPTSTNLNAKAISFACWVNIASWNSSYDALMSIADGTGWQQSRATLCRNNTASTLTWNIADGSTSTRVSTTTSLSTNTWYHIACTYDGTSLKIYLNGVLNNSAAATLSINYAGTFNIGGWSGNNYPLNAKLNDVRIYSHCLSPMEVKELAKGLVLHYPLNRQGWGQENLLTGYDTSFLSYPDGAVTLFSNQMNGGAQEIVSNIVGATKCLHLHSNGGNGRQFGTLSATSGKSYTVSCDYYSTSSQTVPFRGELNGGNYSWAGSNAAAYTTPNKWVRLSFSYLNLTSNATIYYFMQCSQNTDCYIKNLKIEEGSIATPWCPNSSDVLATTMGLNGTTEYDCSGFGNNGTRTGTFSWTSDTPKYSVSSTFGSTSTKIHISNFSTSGFGNSYSFAWWGKTPSWSGLMQWGFSDGIRFNGIYNGNLWNTGDGSNNPIYKPNTTTQITVPSVNVWHHYVMTGDGTTNKLYVDGELYGTSKTYKGISGTSIYLNGWDSGTTYCHSNYQMSDFRIYATALSADDVKSLYQNSAYIDSSGNVYGAVHSEV